MEIDYKAIGQRIKIARIKKGMTQEVVSYIVDVTPAHMSNIETGKTKVSLLLVDILKSAKKAIRKDRKVRNMFEM